MSGTMARLILTVIVVALVKGGQSSDSKIEDRLLLQNAYSKSNVFVTFHNGTDVILQTISKARFSRRADKLNALHRRLVDHADRTQANVISYLRRGLSIQDSKFKSLWISNQVYLKDATMNDIKAIAAFPEVKSITRDEIIKLDDMVIDENIRRAPPGNQWGIVKIQAPEAIQLLEDSPVVASPVIVATIDTGCRHTHEALRDNWVQDYGWFDPYEGNLIPMDIDGHGTHCTGTIVGSGGIGVYPAAKWMACRGCRDSSFCRSVELLQCAQFVICPTFADGSGEDCSKAAHVVSNSWSAGRGATWYDSGVAAFRAAGIIPIFAIGNDGPSCATTRSPGESADVIGVGSVMESNEISPFSSVGPSFDGRIKPDVSAPGSAILSASNRTDDMYRTMSGTSMACPHASGLASLMLAYNPNLSYDEIKSHMQGGADQNLFFSGATCSGIPDSEFPNHHFGQGRINSLKSLQLLIAETTTPTSTGPTTSMVPTTTTIPTTTTPTTTTTLPTTTVPTTPSQPFRCTVEGVFPNTDNCTMYNRCIKIGASIYTYIMTCPAGSYFNAGARKCLLGWC